MIILKEWHHAFYITNEWGDNLRVGLNFTLALHGRKAYMGLDLEPGFPGFILGLLPSVVLIVKWKRD